VVVAEVPATSANLGPGFDAFGLALDWREEVHLEVIDHGFSVEVSGEGAEQIPRDESHLIIRSVLLGLADLGVGVSGLRLRGHNTIPHGRGLGSSSAAIVAGLIAARELAGLEPDPDWALGHATAIEGHPDNVAAAVHGGFVIAYGARDGVRVAAPVPASDLAGVVFVPSRPVATAAARGLLPDHVPHVDAAENAGRAALLVHALTRQPELLLEATRDRLHQEYRRPAMIASYDLMTELRGRGYAAVISGAGPSVLVLGQRADLAELAGQPVRGFTVRAVGVGTGARVVPGGGLGAGK
jgi:homoserine kinase